MARDLYIYTLDEKCEFHKKVWKDVKITRDDGKIVTKESADYRLRMGSYKHKENLDKIQVISCGFPTPVINRTEYITFDKEEITDDIKTQLAAPFINRYNEEQKELQEQMDKLDDLISKFLHIKEEN